MPIDCAGVGSRLAINIRESGQAWHERWLDIDLSNILRRPSSLPIFFARSWGAHKSGKVFRVKRIYCLQMAFSFQFVVKQVQSMPICGGVCNVMSLGCGLHYEALCIILIFDKD